MIIFNINRDVFEKFYFKKMKRKNDEDVGKRAKNFEEVILKPEKDAQTIFLNDDKTSWIVLSKINPNFGLTMDEFEELFKLRPAEKEKIKIAGKVIECPRYSKSYLKPYRYSGMIHEAEKDLPPRIEKLLNDCKQINPSLNQCLVNWYESDGLIGKHSDDKSQLIKDSDIFSLSFGPGKRMFLLEPKDKTPVFKVFKVMIEHNTLIIMGGKCQTTHLHSVPKIKKADQNADQNADVERRLNVTFRCFK
jgi:alkylated DNA repair dioxygenase AlkB